MQRRLSASGKTYSIVLNDPEAETCALTEAGYKLLTKSFVSTLPALLARLAEWGVQDVDLSGSDRLSLEWCYGAEPAIFDVKLLELSVLDHPEGGSVHLGYARLP